MPSLPRRLLSWSSVLRSTMLGFWREVWYRSSSLKPRLLSKGTAAASSVSRVSASSHLTLALTAKRSTSSTRQAPNPCRRYAGATTTNPRARSIHRSPSSPTAASAVPARRPSVVHAPSLSVGSSTRRKVSSKRNPGTSSCQCRNWLARSSQGFSSSVLTGRIEKGVLVMPPPYPPPHGWGGKEYGLEVQRDRAADRCAVDDAPDEPDAGAIVRERRPERSRAGTAVHADTDQLAVDGKLLIAAAGKSLDLRDGP